MTQTKRDELADAHEKKVLSKYGVIIAPSIDFLAGFSAALQSEEVRELRNAFQSMALRHQNGEASLDAFALIQAFDALASGEK